MFSLINVFAYPMEMYYVRKTTDLTAKNHKLTFCTFNDTCLHVCKDEGIKGLYKGAVVGTIGRALNLTALMGFRELHN